MHNETKIYDDLYYVGASDRRLALFENVYPLENGVSYNSYLYLDEKTCLLDTVDRSVSDVFYENLSYLLKDRPLDYLIVNHMEPDHAANIGELLLRHPEVTIVINQMAKKFLLNYFPNISAKFIIVKEGDSLSIGKHKFSFLSAPMVHWPEVMMTYEGVDKILYSADAFGTFGALSGSIFADMSKWEERHLKEARRYYTNIVGKYGPQVTAVLKKASSVEIKGICPLHGPLLFGNLNAPLSYYAKWASYSPESNDSVMIAYSSIYGNTANATDILANRLARKGIVDIVTYDVSKTDCSVLLSEAFRVHTIVLAATTYNAGVFVKMEDFLHDLANHALANRTIAFLENGSWAPAAKANMQKILSPLKGMKYLNNSLTIVSSLKEEQLSALDILAETIANDIGDQKATPEKAESPIDSSALFKLSYGLFALLTKDKNGKDNASINNSFFQIASSPTRFLLSVNKANYSCNSIMENGIFNISSLDVDTDFSLIKRFGFQSGRNVNKFEGFEDTIRTSNGLLRLSKCSNAYFSLKVVQTIDAGSHMLFIAELSESKVLNARDSLTYADYFKNVKPRALPSPSNGEKKKIAWRCKICGYVYVGDALPEGFICPLCKHPASDFEKIEL